MTIVEFLQARLDEDEQAARAATGKLPSWGDRWTVDRSSDILDSLGEIVAYGTRPPRLRAISTHIARHDPARVLAEATAKRQVLAELEDGGGLEAGYLLHAVIRHFAAVYADHPDYDPEWRP